MGSKKCNMVDKSTVNVYGIHSAWHTARYASLVYGAILSHLYHCKDNFKWCITHQRSCRDSHIQQTVFAKKDYPLVVLIKMGLIATGFP